MNNYECCIKISLFQSPPRIVEIVKCKENTKASKLEKIKIIDRILGPPLWSSGQSSWLQIQRSRFDSRRYQIFFLRSSVFGTGSTEPRDDN
jgi:hypothetical protein